MQDVVDEAIRHEERVQANRSMRLLEIEEDGSHLRLWVSAAMDFHDDTVWSPKSLRQTVVEKCRLSATGQLRRRF